MEELSGVWEPCLYLLIYFIVVVVVVGGGSHVFKLPRSSEGFIVQGCLGGSVSSLPPRS